MKKQLFRQTALDEMASPERIDEYIRISSVSTFVILGGLLLFMCALLIWGVAGHVSENVKIQGVVFPFEGTRSVKLPKDGVVRDLFVKRGDYVHAGDRLALVSIEQQFSVLFAPADGMVISSKDRSSQFVAYEPIVNLLRQDSSRCAREVIAFTTFENLRKLKVGMPVQVSPLDLPREKYGYMKGTIVGVDDYPLSKQEALNTLKVESFANDIFPEKATFAVRVLLTEDPEHAGKIHWSHAKEEDVHVDTGTFCNIQIVTKRMPVYMKLFEDIDDTVRKVSLWLE